MTDDQTFRSDPAGPKALATSPTASAALVLIAVILAAFALWALRAVVTPLILAVFLMLLIGAMEAGLTRRLHLPRAAALPSAIGSVVGLFAAAAWLMLDNGAHMLKDSAQYAARLDSVLQAAATQFGLGAAPTIDQIFRQIDPQKHLAEAASAFGGVAEATFLVLIYLAFLLAARPGFSRKLAEMFGDGEDRHVEALTILRRIQAGVESYIWVQTAGGIMVALGSAAVMAAFGVSHVAFWAFVIFMVNYIPAIGLVIGVVGPTLFALIELDALWKAVLVFIAMEVVHFVVGHIVLPRMQGRSLNIDPLVVLLSLAFWSALFGLTGAFLSTPLTVIVMAICAEFPKARPLAVLLSADGRPFAAEQAAAPDPGSV